MLREEMIMTKPRIIVTGATGNVLAIHQLFLRERQCFHKGWCLILGLRVNEEDDAFACMACRSESPNSRIAGKD